MKQALVIGLGNFGFSLVQELRAKGCEVTIIEQNQVRAQQAEDIVSQIIVADAAQREILEQYARDVDVAIVSLGEKVDSSILVTHLLKELGVKKIIAKAISDDHGKILSVVGANEVIFPERDAAKRLVTSLVSPDILEYIRVSEDFDILEVAVPDKFIGQTLRILQLRNKYGVEILAIKNALTSETQIMPSPDYQMKPDDILIMIGEVGKLKKFSV